MAVPVAPPQKQIERPAGPAPCLLSGADGKNRPILGAAPGFTLIELLLAVLLLGLVSTMIYSVLNIGIGFADRGDARILALERQHNFLALLHGQIRAAWYDAENKKLGISSDDDTLRIVTRQPLLNQETGMALAVYRINHAENTVYYIEKKDYYNIDYDDEYIPDFADMQPLIDTDGPINLRLDDLNNTVVIEYQGKEHVISPKCGEPVTIQGSP